MFPQLFDPAKLRKGIDKFVDGIVTDYGDSLGALSDHFDRWLAWFEKLLRVAPWWSVVLAGGSPAVLDRRPGTGPDGVDAPRAPPPLRTRGTRRRTGPVRPRRTRRR